MVPIHVISGTEKDTMFSIRLAVLRIRSGARVKSGRKYEIVNRTHHAQREARDFLGAIDLPLVAYNAYTHN